MRKHLAVGAIGSLGLLAFYALVTAWSNQWSGGALGRQFQGLWFWLLPLALGFGLQLSLYSRLRSAVRQAKSATAELVGSGAVNSVAMVACCAHNIATLLPVLGLSAVVTILVRYQVPMLVFGLASNVFGVVVMTHAILRHRVYDRGNILVSRMSSWNWPRIRTSVIALGAMVVAASAFAAGRDSQGVPQSSFSLEPKADGRGYVEVIVEPRELSYGEPVTFSIRLDTHVVDLGYDMSAITSLSDQNGTGYRVLSVDEALPPGHHRALEITFEPLRLETSELRLVVAGVNDIDRVFLWTLAPG